MQKSIVSFLLGVLIVSILSQGQNAYAQQLSFPAEINKSFTPISIPAGGISRLRVTIYNPNAFQLTSASWTDNLIRVQPGLAIASSVNLSNTCGGTVSAAAGGTTLSLSGGIVPAQSGITPGSCTVAVDVTATIPGNLINTLPSDALTSIGGGGIITNTSPASATLNVTGTVTATPPPTPLPPTLPPVEVDKNFSPTTIWAGGVSQLTIVIRNNQTSANLTQTSLVDNLPANVFLASPVSPSLSGCGASASVTAFSGGTTVTLNNGRIAPSSTCTIRVNVTSDVQGAFTNRILANSLRTQEGLTNPSDATDRLRVDAIGITKAFSPGTITAGGTATLTITLQNPTNSAYTGATFNDNLPSPLTVASVIQNSCGGTLSTSPVNTIRLTGGVIPAGSPTTPGTCTISVQVSVPVDATSARLTNTIPANGLTTDQGVSNPRTTSDRITLRGTDVTASKSFSDGTITLGENTRLRIDFIAPGDTDLTNFSITDDLPAGMTISNSTPASMSGCGDSASINAATGGSSISLTGGLILAGQRCRIQVYVTGNLAGSYTNTIPLSNITNNENRLPPADLTANLTINNPSPNAGNLAMALVKGFEPLTVFGGAASTMSVLLINPGNVALTGIAFIDTMPSGMVLANPLNFNVGSCGGTLSGVSGTSSFSFSGGNLPAGSRCTLTLSVTMTVNGNLTNTIPENAVTTLQGASNPDPAEASLTNLPGASVSKFFSSNPIVAGDSSLLTITIQNTGNVALSGMGLKDTLPGTLPAGLVIANLPESTNTCDGDLTAVAGTQIIELTNGSLDASAACSIVVSVTSNTPGSYQNTIPAGTLISDQGATNHSAATDTLVVTVRRSGRGGGRDSTPDVSAVNTFLIPVTGFAPGRMAKLAVSSRPVYDVTALTLEIPVLKVKTPIVGVDFRDGNWDVSWLQNQVGWLNGTAYPTWEGNSVLTAHVTNADGKPGIFSKLKALGVGEYVFVLNSGYRYIYKVVSNAFVRPNDASVIKHEEKSFLTLITCDTYDEKTGTYLRRVAVRAVLVDVSEIK